MSWFLYHVGPWWMNSIGADLFCNPHDSEHIDVWTEGPKRFIWQEGCFTSSSTGNIIIGCTKRWRLFHRLMSTWIVLSVFILQKVYKNSLQMRLSELHQWVHSLILSDVSVADWYSNLMAMLIVMLILMLVLMWPRGGLIFNSAPPCGENVARVESTIDVTC